MIRKLLTLCSLLIATVYANADNIQFKAETTSSVEVGESFRLTFSVNTMDASDLRIPTINDFEILMGPSRSQQSYTQIINGRQTSSQKVVFTYILSAKKVGTYTIQPATVMVNGKKYQSNPVKIQVVAEGRAKVAKEAAKKTTVGKNDVFLRTIVSKSKVREQEAVLVSYKLYSLVNLELQNKSMPEFTGFHAQAVESDDVKSWSVEQYQGKTYRTVVTDQYVLFPQQSGTLKIPSVEYDIVAHVANQQASDDLFESIFNGTSVNYINLKIKAPTQNIEVLPLKDKPADFSGGVGTFSITSALSSKQAVTNDAVTLKVEIKGNGNLKLLKTPELTLPKEFETYEPKVNNEIKATASGVSGIKTIEYLFVPRHPGKFSIPAISLSYYDVSAGAYKTITTSAHELEVKKGEGNASQTIADFTNQQDVKVLANDVRFIKQGETRYSDKDAHFFGTWTYVAWYIVPFVGFVVLLVALRKHRINNADVEGKKHKRANKVALKRMKIANGLLRTQQKSAFYDEVLRALWGYVSDKLSIPVAELTKDNVSVRLTDAGVQESVVEEFIALLNDCEMAHYVSGNDGSTMDKIYATSLSVMEKLEDSIKN